MSPRTPGYRGVPQTNWSCPSSDKIFSTTSIPSRQASSAPPRWKSRAASTERSPGIFEKYVMKIFSQNIPACRALASLVFLAYAPATVTAETSVGVDDSTNAADLTLEQLINIRVDSVYGASK